ncbi:MAG: TetR/AcrR family transcriptional regulator [Desulfatirhabdiaceae bacterium]|nr:TetR/AcrR family transcriptional regulator [Desulfatirhabdiaceae bacterium]
MTELIIDAPDKPISGSPHGERCTRADAAAYPRCADSRDIFTGAPGTDQPAAIETRERILMAAGSLFADKGYAGTSVREIVETAGVTKPTLYYYFKSKEDLYLQLMDMAADSFNEIFEEIRCLPGGMRIRLINLFTRLFEMFRDYTDIVRLVNSTIWGAQNSAPFFDFKSKHGIVEAVFTKILQDGIAEGELTENRIQEVLIILMGVLHSMQIIPVIKPEGAVLNKQVIERIVHTVFDGPREKEIKEQV